MNILYIASPNSVHDLKWISWFSKMPDNKAYLLSEEQNWVDLKDNMLIFMKENHINICDPVRPFSFLKPNDKRSTIRSIRKLCKDKEIDLVHALFATPNAMWALYSGKNFIITTRGSDVLHVLPDVRRPGWQKFYLRYLFHIYQEAFTKASFITSTSYPQKNAVEELFGRSDTEIVRTGINIDVIDAISNRDDIPIELSGKEFIISPRWIQPLYNTTAQAKAITRLDAAILERYTFVFFKNHGTTTEYLDETKRILSSARVKFIIYDSLPQKNMMSCTRWASLCFMMPDRDGTPNSALEAMAAKCPLIVGSFGYDIDLFKDTCIHLTEDTPEMLSRAITLALKQYPEGMIERAYETVRRNGNQSVEMEKIAKLYISCREKK